MFSSHRTAPSFVATASLIAGLLTSACQRAPERSVEGAPRPAQLAITRVPAAPPPVSSPAPEPVAPDATSESKASDAVLGGVDVAPLPTSGSGLVSGRERARRGAPSVGLAGPKRAMSGGAAPAEAIAPLPSVDGEAYAARADAAFASVEREPLSTFSIDVDTASYSNVRRFIQQGQLPPPGAVRIEELINYFPYAYPEPRGDEPVAVTTELSRAPWDPAHLLLSVALQATRMETAQLPARNLVFLLDVSGSMDAPNKLPLLKRSLLALTETLGERDRVALVVYAGASGVVLPPTSGRDKAQIVAALDRLEAGGSTNGQAGIELAYSIASDLARPGASTRVILATDGDFNVGMTSEDSLVRLISKERASGVFLSVLGFGMGNYKDATLERLADEGNGNYAYVDTLAEARKVLVAEGGATLVTLAQDVKLQLEFNPRHVASYRLIGYENRRLESADFNDDAKDAGELGAGHRVTALYEIIPPLQASPQAAVDPLRYQATSTVPGHSAELCTIKLRYKTPGGSSSRALARQVTADATALEQTSAAFRFAAAVATFGMVLRRSPDRGASNYGLARELAQGALGQDLDGYQRELISLIDGAAALDRGTPGPLAMP
jgi:Ca-activated chloride channel family protein